MTIVAEARGTLPRDAARLIDADVPIATIPQCLDDVLKVLEDPDCPVHEVVGIIERDPSIASRVLKLVNSPAFGLSSSVTALSQACVILGLRTLRQVLVQATVVEKLWFDVDAAGFDAYRLWDHSFKAAVAARHLARAIPEAVEMDPEEAYTCGLLHDMGKILLLQNQTKRFLATVAAARRSDTPLVVAERETFGFTDLEVCARLVQRWRLGPTLEQAVLRHHQREPSPVAWARGRLVHAASTLAHAADPRGPAWIADPLRLGEITELGIEQETIHDLVRALGERSGMSEA